MRANSVNSSILPGNRHVSGFRTPRHHSRQMFQVLVGYQLIRCHVFSQFTPQSLPIPSFHCFLSPFLGGQQKFMRAFLSHSEGWPHWIVGNRIQLRWGWCVCGSACAGMLMRAAPLCGPWAHARPALCQHDGSVALSFFFFFFADLKRSEV